MTVLHIIAQLSQALFWASAAIYCAITAEVKQSRWRLALALALVVTALAIACELGVDMGRFLQAHGQ